MIKALVLMLLAALPARAQTQDDVLSAQLLPGWRLDNGHYMAALDLTLAPHWKTYWRSPGEAGIPPQFDWSGSQNVASVALHWPSPSVFTLNGLQSIGYMDALILPVEVTPRDPALPVTLSLHLQLGICKDICMPAAVALTMALDGGAESDRRIAAALQNQPMTGQAAGLTGITCALAPIADGMHIMASLNLPQQGSPETVAVEVADPLVWVATASASRDGPVLSAATDLVPDKGAPFVLDRSRLTITVIGQGHSVEIKGCPAP